MVRICRLAPLLVCLVVAAGCGGSSSSPGSTSSSSVTTTAAKAKIVAPAHVTLKAGLLGDESSAGSSESYTPTGEIVSDSGFRPQVDGFGFENYGNDAGPVNLKPANVEDIFGSQVCALGAGTSCRLIPAAKQWMDQENEAMAGGHCMGFSVTALRFFAHEIKPDPYGADKTIELPIQGNTDLQSLIAEDFAYQSLPAVTDKTVEGTPTKVLEALVAALKAKTEQYTLGIFKSDGSGGHAITPFAVEDKGDGRAKILAYDNNFPGVIRGVDVNTTADTWRYVGGINPSDTDEVYSGDARTQSMMLLPTSPGEGHQACPFCPAKAKADPVYPVPEQGKYIEVVLHGTTANHPHLLFTDPQDRKTGYSGGRFVNEIPGAKVVQDFSVRNWKDGAEPKFHLPLKHPQYIVTVDGSTLTKKVKNHITINGAGIVFSIGDAYMDPGQVDHLIMPANDLGIGYLSGRKAFPGSATLEVQFPQFDRSGKVGGKPKVRLVTLATGWIGLTPGDPLQLRLDPSRGIAEIASTGGTPAGSGTARFVISLDQQLLNTGAESGYFGSVDHVAVDQGQTLRFHYLRASGAKLPVDVLDANGKAVGRVQIPPKKF